MSVVRAQYGPTLLQILASKPLRVRVAAGALAFALLAATVVIALRSRPDETVVLLRSPTTFNFAYGPRLDRVERPGALVALRRPRTGELEESFVVRDLRLPAYQGAVGGMLPVYADGYMRALRRRYPGYSFVNEGRSRINNGVGYQIAFRARLGGRALYVRHFLIVPELPDGRRRGVVLELESRFSRATPNPLEVGLGGQLKQPLRSFRFGEERKGGTS